MLETPGRRAERLKAERMKEEEERKVEVEAKVKEEADRKARAKRDVWLKCQIALCAEVGAPGNPKERDLLRWMSRMAGVNAMGFAALQDIKEVAKGLHYDEARAMLRLALATNVVALYERDEEVVVAQAKVEGEVEGGADEARGEKLEARVQNPEPRKPEGHPQISQITQIARKDDAPAGYILNCPGCGRKFVTPEPFGSLCPWCTAARDGKE